MDWQAVSDVSLQAQQRIRKESNSCQSGSVDTSGGTAGGASSGLLVGASNLNDGINGFHPDTSSAFLHQPLRLSDTEDLRLDQDGNCDGSINSDGNANAAAALKKQQKSNNIEQLQVAARLSQIRDYIGQTSSVMERLHAAGTPQHMELWLRLATMLEGLRDSESKLTTLQNRFVRLEALNDLIEQDKPNSDENDADDDNSNQEASFIPKSADSITRRNELKIMVEESQKKSMELRDQQAALLALKQKAQKQLKEYRAAQGALLAAREQPGGAGNSMDGLLQCLRNVSETRNELAELVGNDASSTSEDVLLQNKLEELQAKKVKTDQLLAQINAINVSAGAVINPEGEPTFEEKKAELAMLKEKLSRMQTALSNMTGSLPGTSSSPPTITSANLCYNPQETENHDDVSIEDRFVNLHFKQDNRTQAVSQNHRHPSNTMITTPPASLCTSVSADNGSESLPNIAYQQQQIHAKSLKLQEAKARLHHWEELLSLVEGFREAGKPVPEKLLQILNAPNGPLSNDDHLDLESDRSQSQQQPSSPSSSLSSVLSLIQLNASASNNVFSFTGTNDPSSLQPSNRSEIGLQNLYRPPPVSTPPQPEQKLQGRQQRQQRMTQHAFPSKHIKNNVTKSCAKTHELEEWMKKDDPMSSINTDMHSQQHGCFLSSGYNYQETPTSATWGGSADYSSEDGGGSENDNELEELVCNTASSSMNVNLGVGTGTVVISNPMASASGVESSNAACKEPLPAACSGCPPRFYSRELLDASAGGASNSGLQNCGTCAQTPRKQVCRKHSTGSGSSLPSHSATTRVGPSAPPRGTWTPTNCCCHSRRHESTAASNGSGTEEVFVRSNNLHHTIDNNTNWIVQQITQLQAQLQQMYQTMNDKYSHGLMTHNVCVPSPLPFCHPPNIPHLQTAAPIGSNSSLNNFLSPQPQNMLSMLNQCCQLVWHQQCELASLKESMHALQQHQCQNQTRFGVGSTVQPPYHNEENSIESTTDHHTARSNLERCPSQQQHRNRSTVSPTPVPVQPPLISVPPAHYFYPPYGNNLNLSFQPFQNPNPVGTFMGSPTGTLNNQVPPGNRANNYWDNFRSYSRQNLLSLRSKRNEGRGSVTGELNGTNGGRLAREMQAALPAGSTATTPVLSVGLTQQQTQSHQSQVPQLQQQSNTSLDDVMTHNLPNHKEKLNASYQSHFTSAVPCVNNIRVQPAMSATHIDQPARQSVAISTSVKSAHGNTPSTLFKSNPSKGACKKTCRAKDSPQLQQGGVGFSGNCNNPNINNENNSIGGNSNSNRSWNCGVGGTGLQDECVTGQNNRPLTQGATAAVEIDLPRNSNCRRSQLMNVSSSSLAMANTNKCKSSIRTESNDILDSLEESMYSEVAALISVNEQRPSYLLQLFKDLKQIGTDSDRQAALITIHNLANRSSGPSANTLGPSSPLPVSLQHVEGHDNSSLHRSACSTESVPVVNNEYNNAHNSNVMDSTQCRRQPRNLSWRCSKDSMSLSSVLPVSCRKLDWEVQSVLVEILPFLKMHLAETCTQSVLESIRNLVLQLVPSPQHSPGQLDALLEDGLFKFQGCRLRDICDELITVIAEVLISELTFLRLTTSVNGTPTVTNGSDFSVVENEEDEDVDDGIVEEEGAVGGDVQIVDHSATDQIVRCSKSDAVVLDAELAEADQSSRHTAAAVSASATDRVGLLVSCSANGTQPEALVQACESPEYQLRDHNYLSNGELMSEDVEDDANKSDAVSTNNNNNNNNNNKPHKRNNTAPSLSDAVDRDREHLDRVPTRLNPNTPNSTVATGTLEPHNDNSLQNSASANSANDKDNSVAAV